MIKNTRKGFTITELVIVIAVIAILAAVLIPTFSGIVSKANDSKTLQEARNLMVNHIAANDGDVDPVYYIEVTNGSDNVYYKVTNGQLSDTKEASAPTANGTVIVSKDTANDTDDWPDVRTITAG